MFDYWGNFPSRSASKPGASPFAEHVASFLYHASMARNLLVETISTTIARRGPAARPR